jgi:formate-dependent nitrite reductase membrane component NrfD
LTTPPLPPPTQPPDAKSQTPRDKRLAWAIAIALTLVGLVVTLLELRNLLWPKEDLPGSNLFWLVIGLMTLVLGVIELILGPGRPKK